MSRDPRESAASDADEARLEHIRNGGEPDPGDDVGLLLKMIRDGEIEP